MTWDSPGPAYKQSYISGSAITATGGSRGRIPMERFATRKGWAAVAAFLALASSPRANPALTPGVWLNITPAAAKVSPADNVFCQGMAIDPNHPSTLYLGVCAFDVAKPVGLYKS